MIEVDPGSGTAVLHGSTSTYALRVDPGSRSVRPLHWGARVSLGDAVALPVRDSHHDGFTGWMDADEEVPVDGGPRFGAPALQVRFADGARALELDHDGTDVVDGELVVRLADRARPLAVDLHYRARRDTDVLERRLVVRHTGGPGDPPVTVLRATAGQWCLPELADYRCTSVHGGWAREGALTRTPVAHGETTLTSRRGHTGHDAGPWVLLDDGTAVEDAGEVFAIGVATSGSWRITVQRTAEGRCGVLAGAGHEGVQWQLAPGEELATPVSTGLRVDGGFGAVSRASHAHLRAHVLPHPAELRPVLYDSWEATGFEVTEEGQLELARVAARLGVELFVVDDGWFSGRDGATAGLGDWWPHPGRFPRGLRPLSDEVHRLGMAFGLWVEPEMVNLDSDLYRTHPDWVLHETGRERMPVRDQLVLDFSRSAVRDWASEWLTRTVREAGVDFLKWDFNRPFTGAGDPSAGPHTDRVFVDHARGVHAVLDRLRATFPALRVEGCAAGGGRVDAAVLARCDQVWTSDNTDAAERIGIQHGFTQVFPPAVMSCWVTDSPNPWTGRALPLRFRFHVAMAGVLGIGGHIARWSEEDLAEAADLVAVYRDVRAVVQHGDLHRLRGPGGDEPTTVVQHIADRGERTVVLAWRPEVRFGHLERPVRLRGLDVDADYVDEDTGARVSGRSLTARGLDLPLPSGGGASALVRLRRERS